MSAMEMGREMIMPASSSRGWKISSTHVRRFNGISKPDASSAPAGPPKPSLDARHSMMKPRIIEAPPQATSYLGFVENAPETSRLTEASAPPPGDARRGIPA